MFTFPARRSLSYKNANYFKYCSNFVKISSAKMSTCLKYPWSFIYIAGPDHPIYLKRKGAFQNESESRISKTESQLFRQECSKYLLFAKRESNAPGCQRSYIETAIKSHLAYRQKDTWPQTSFSHVVFFDEEGVSKTGSNGCLSRGVFCCGKSTEQQTNLQSQIEDFLKTNSNFIAYEIVKTVTKNETCCKLSLIGDNTSEYDDNKEIEVEMISRPEMKRSKEIDPVTSPIFLIPEISPVFQSYKDARAVLDELSGVPEVKELLDITDKCVTIATEKTCDQNLVHPFVVVEGMDATGKTTLTEVLEKKMGAARYFTPPPEINHLRAFFDKYPEIVRRAYYSMGNYIVASEIVQECQTRPVIMDRFWHSTAAYGIANETSSGDMPEPNHSVYKWPTDLLKPTIVLFLTVSEDVRKQRLIGRGLQATFEEKSLDNDQLFRQRLCDAYRRMNSPSCLEIDTGGTVEEVQNKALEVLASHGVDLSCK